MARWEAQRWLVHPFQGRELVAYSSGTDEEYANERAIGYAEALMAAGFELELVDGDGVHATKGGEKFVICVREMEV